MAKIDRLIANLVQRRISVAALQPDTAVLLDMGGGETRPLNERKLSARQIEMVLFEILPDKLKEQLRYSGNTDFDYESPSGSVRVTAIRRGGKLSVYLATGRALRHQEPEHSELGAEVSERSSAAGETSAGETRAGETSAGETSEARFVDKTDDVDERHEFDQLDEVGDEFSLTEESSIVGVSEPDYELDASNAESFVDDIDILGVNFDESSDAASSSFVDATARPSAVHSALGMSLHQPEERSIPMNEPGTEVPIDRYLRVMYEEGCSDLHLTSNNPPLYRLDGDMRHLRHMEPLTPTAVEELLLPIIPDNKYEEFLEIRDTDFAYEIKGVGRFRCNVFMDRQGPGAVFRLIPDELLTAEDLKLSEQLLELCFLNKGLVLVTGPTGSGKSTTLAALIDYINRKRKSHIITVEDPIEFVHENKECLINQREVGVHTMSFKNAIRAALREDPDIVLVGELRDLETIHMAIETAETGHLVFGTLHTNTAPSTVDRLVDQFPTDRQAQIRTMLSGSLRAVIAQTLCKKIGGGRVAAMEILIATRAVSNLIREAKTHQLPSVMETKKSEGMCPLNDSLMELVEQKKISPEEAFFNAIDKHALRRRLESGGYRLDL